MGNPVSCAHLHWGTQVLLSMRSQFALALTLSALGMVPVRGEVALGPEIRSFLSTHCISCHGEKKQKGKVTLHQLDADFTDGGTLALWERVLEQLEIGEMPPDDKVQPKAARRQEVIDWIKQQQTAAGKGFQVAARMELPEHGNRVSHELLFSGEVTELPYTPSRLWRMSPHIYRGKNYQTLVQGGLEAKPITYRSKSSGIRDYASQEIMGEAGFLSLKMALEDIISDQMHDRQLAPKSWGPDAGKMITVPGKESFKAISEAEGAPSGEAMQRVIREEFQRATGRPITPAEMERFLAFMTSNIAAGGNELGLKITLLGIYLSTEAVYRFELGRGPADEHGRRMLSPPEVALALAYALTDSPPADLPILQKALAENRLSNKKDIEAVVREMIEAGAPPLRRHLPASIFHRLIQEAPAGYGYFPRVVRFFEEFFQYPKAESTFKDSPGRPIGGRSLIGAPQGHIVRIVNADRKVFEELLSSPRFNNNKEQMLAMLEKRHQERLRTSPKEKHPAIMAEYQKALKQADHMGHDSFRAGMLTDHSWLITHSTNDANDPVHRGIWIRTRLLGGMVPDLPIDVEAKIPEHPHRTLRDRFDVTRAEKCWRCHRSINPLGMPFESFTDRGWVRTGMYFDKKRQRFETELTPEQIEKGLASGNLEKHPFDTTGAITGTDEPETDGPVKNARDLVLRLSKSKRVRQSIIRHAFRYWMGRNEMLSDSPTLIAADRAYVESGGAFSEVLVSLLTSDSFLYRK